MPDSRSRWQRHAGQTDRNQPYLEFDDFQITAEARMIISGLDRSKVYVGSGSGRPNRRVAKVLAGKGPGLVRNGRQTGMYAAIPGGDCFLRGVHLGAAV